MLSKDIFLNTKHTTIKITPTIMMTKISKFALVLTIIFATIFLYLKFKKNEEKRILTLKKGNYSLAKIIGKEAFKGNIRILEFKIIKIDKKGISSVQNSFFRTVQIGDTIIVKTHKDLLPFSIVCEEIFYKPCFGLDPKNGWKEVPKCK
jgi:hypothetical protein